MPTHERLGADDRENVQDRWKPAIQMNQEPAVVVRQPDPALHLTPQNDQLMAENRVFCLKPGLRLEWRGQTARTKRAAESWSADVRRFSRLINADKVFGTHTRRLPQRSLIVGVRSAPPVRRGGLLPAGYASLVLQYVLDMIVDGGAANMKLLGGGGCRHALR